MAKVHRPCAAECLEIRGEILTPPQQHSGPSVTDFGFRFLVFFSSVLLFHPRMMVQCFSAFHYLPDMKFPVYKETKVVGLSC